MRKLLALFRVNALQAASYRLNLIFSLAGLIGVTIPIYFVAGALQPVMEDSISAQADNYFAFVLIGIFVFGFLGPATSQLPGIISGGIATGTLEAMMSTSTRLPTLFGGLMSYNYAWQVVRGLLLLAFGSLLGARLLWGQMLFGAVILILIILAYLAFGIIAAAMVLAFRTTGPLSQVILTLSGFLGGVYYPTEVIPSWIENVSAVIPLTYGLRSLRQVILTGAPAGEVLPDILRLSAMAAVLLAISMTLFHFAFQYARRTGSLTHY